MLVAKSAGSDGCMSVTPEFSTRTYIAVATIDNSLMMSIDWRLTMHCYQFSPYTYKGQAQ